MYVLMGLFSRVVHLFDLKILQGEAESAGCSFPRNACEFGISGANRIPLNISEYCKNICKKRRKNA